MEEINIRDFISLIEEEEEIKEDVISEEWDINN